jgi:CBS domain-containing protein
MGETVMARHLMLANFETVRLDENLGVAIGRLVAMQDRDDLPNALAVLGDDAKFIGLLTAGSFAKSLLALWKASKSLPDDDAERCQDLVEFTAMHLTQSVGAVTPSPVSMVASDARLLDVIAVGCEHLLEFIPVVDADRIQGIIPVGVVFQAAADLALTPEDEGIRFDQND